VKEAMACNLPVISVDVGDVKARLRDVWPSKIVPRDVRDIGRALAELLQKPARSNGAYAIRDLTAEKVAEKVLQLYHEALNLSRLIKPENGQPVS
jgi:glycosyltransferase involved in cell wall biosynthesis